MPAAPEGIEIVVDGERLTVPSGRSVAAVLLDRRGPALRRSSRLGAPRGIFCGMGVCYDCLVTLDGVVGQRACVAVVRAGMVIETEPR